MKLFSPILPALHMTRGCVVVVSFPAISEPGAAWRLWWERIELLNLVSRYIYDFTCRILREKGEVTRRNTDRDGVLENDPFFLLSFLRRVRRERRAAIVL